MHAGAPFASHPHGRAVAALVAGGIAIAFAPIFTKLAMVTGELGPTAAAFWRVTIAFPFFYAWQRIAGRTRRTPAPPVRFSPWLLVPGVVFAGDLGVWHASFAYTTLANATLLANFATVFVSIAGYLWLRERFTWRFPAGALIALAGAAVLLGASFQLDPIRVIGDALGLATALFYAAYQLSTKLLRRRFDTVRIMIWASGICAVALLCALPITGERIFSTTVDGWLALVALALVAHCAGQGLIVGALARLPAGFSSVTLLVQPVGAAILSWLIFDEALTPMQLTGGVTVLIGIVLARQGSILTPQPRTPHV